ncbi:hypothetical protein A4A49_27898 [Nicotiana attenuata]|uniref:Uncharacterized protein n=1 Tax=Nicotiana attenuata TaxID=49451 RepID=A0A314KWK3_NICAT|nr:hypothetical protein A4A49_27898 [Nicotiana attenuata]
MMQGRTGKEIVTVDTNNVQQGTGVAHQINDNLGKEIVPATGNDQQDNGNSRREIVPAGAITTQQIQTASKFVALEVQNGDDENNNQLVVVEESTEVRSLVPNPTTTRNLNPAVDVFTPKSNRIEGSKKRITTNPAGNGNITADDVQKETTAAWVNRTSIGNILKQTSHTKKYHLKQLILMQQLGYSRRMKDYNLVEVSYRLLPPAKPNIASGKHLGDKAMITYVIVAKAVDIVNKDGTVKPSGGVKDSHNVEVGLIKNSNPSGIET